MVIHADKCPLREHQRSYIAPEASETAAMILGVEDTLISEYRDIILQCLGAQNAKGNMVDDEINVARRSYDPLVYALIFEFGDDGLYVYKEGKKSTYTLRQFYRSKLFDRGTELNAMLYVDLLF